MQKRPGLLLVVIAFFPAAGVADLVHFHPL